MIMFILCLEKLMAQNICQTTICEEKYNNVSGDGDSVEFILSENEVKITIVNQTEISKVIFLSKNLYKT